MSRIITFWLGTYIACGIVLYFYSPAPLFPILLAGPLTLGLTLFLKRARK